VYPWRPEADTSDCAANRPTRPRGDLNLTSSGLQIRIGSRLRTQPVIDSKRSKPMMRPTPTPAASFSSLPNARAPVTGLVRVGET